MSGNAPLHDLNVSAYMQVLGNLVCMICSASRLPEYGVCYILCMLSVFIATWARVVVDRLYTRPLVVSSVWVYTQCIT